MAKRLFKELLFLLASRLALTLAVIFMAYEFFINLIKKRTIQ